MARSKWPRKSALQYSYTKWENQDQYIMFLLSKRRRSKSPKRKREGKEKSQVNALSQTSRTSQHTKNTVTALLIRSSNEAAQIKPSNAVFTCCCLQVSSYFQGGTGNAADRKSKRQMRAVSPTRGAELGLANDTFGLIVRLVMSGGVPRGQGELGWFKLWRWWTLGLNGFVETAARALCERTQPSWSGMGLCLSTR